jgi:predicted PurR-regulated permease PerM
MTLQRQVTIWLLALAVIILVLWVLSPILLPFIAGLALAYFLDPVADMLERWGLSRLLSTLLILLVSLLAVVLIFVLIGPVLGDQFVRLAGELPTLIKTLLSRFDELAPAWIKQALTTSGSDFQGSLSGMAGSVGAWLVTLLSSLWSGGMALVNLVSLLVVTPIVAFYMLIDWDHMVGVVDGWLPRQHATAIRSLFSDIDRALAGFIRGQGTVCLVLGTFYGLALTLAGLRFGLVIGMGAGLLSFIPYVGALIGGITAIGVAVVQFWAEPGSILIVLGIFMVGQFLEGNFLSPKLVGGSIGVHPVWLMFALFAFGYLFGFVGLLLAVPMAAATAVLIRFGLKQYLKSRLYQHMEPPQPAPVPLPRPSRSRKTK